MDTTILEAKIKELEIEISDKQRSINLLKDGISMEKRALKIYQDGLDKIKERSK
jgi:uncharacterized coiled-coil protein SlyX